MLGKSSTNVVFRRTKVMLLKQLMVWVRSISMSTNRLKKIMLDLLNPRLIGLLEMGRRRFRLS